MSNETGEILARLNRLDAEAEADPDPRPLGEPRLITDRATPVKCCAGHVTAVNRLKRRAADKLCPCRHECDWCRAFRPRQVTGGLDVAP